MIGPTWLAAVLGAVMLVAAAASVARLIAARGGGKATDLEVDIHNVVMGIAMAGMLIPATLIVTAGASTVAWIVVWIAISVWFAFSVVREVSRRGAGGRFRGHHLPHLVMSGAMVYMFAVQGSDPGSMAPVSAMSGMGAGGLVALPTLDYSFVIFMVGYAVVVLDRLPIIATVGRGETEHGGGSREPISATPLAPRTAAATNIVMALTMGYMLTMMFI